MRSKKVIKKLFANIIFLSCILPIQLTHAFSIDDNYIAKWSGIEVIGTDEETAQKIRKNMPIKIGGTFSASSAEKYCAACKKNMKKKWE